MIFASGTTIGSRYRLKEELAKGGMGSVWVARHLQLDVDVAIKFMAPAAVSSASARSRFEREAKAAAQLQHPHIVHVHDFGFEGHTPYLVMELLRGESLEERLKRELRLSLPAIGALLIPIGRGLRRAHEAGFVHRDLKPGNIFIAGSADEENVKILDFGIAKQTNAPVDFSSTKTGEVIGSPHYMSPEQITGSKDIDGRSDLWSLGVILYRAVTGELPFPGTTLGAVMGNVLTSTVAKPSYRVRGLPEAMDRFFERAFARDRGERFSSVKEMVDAFMQFTVIAGQNAPPAKRDSGSSWQAQRASPIARAEAEQYVADMQGVSPLLSGGASGTDRSNRASQPSNSAEAPTVGGASLRATGPKKRGGRTVKLPLPAGGSEPPPSPAGSWASAAGPGQQPSQAAAAPVVRGAPLTMLASADRTIRVRREGQGDEDASKDSRKMQGILLLALAGVVAIVAALVTVLRSSEQTGAAPAQVSPSGEPAGSAGAPALSPTALVPLLTQAAPAPSASGTAEPSKNSLPEGDAKRGPAPSQPTPRGLVAVPQPKQDDNDLVPSGQAKLSVSAKGGSCKVTIDLVSHGATPVVALVKPGTVRVYCRTPTGSTKRSEVYAAEGKTTYVTFDLKPSK